MQKNINLKVELEIPEDLSVEPLYLCSIFVNLLDNAIRGTQYSGMADPSICVTGRMGGYYTVYEDGVFTANVSLLAAG